jgi:CubicO group peptidase (beta-lactamase class C family)
VTTTGLSAQRLDRMHEVLADYVARRELSGLVTVLRRRGGVHVDAVGTLSFDDPTPMTLDTPFRIASLTKPITAVAAMILVEEGVVRLDDPVDPLLPELADRRVLVDYTGPLSDTVPADRAITLRDLLTFRSGFGVIMATPGTYPLQKAMEDGDLHAGPDLVALSADEWISRLGELPLAAQPGTTWMYHTSADILGVLIERASGRSLDDFMRERILTPLGMTRTGFQLRAGSGPLPECYLRDAETGEVKPRLSPTEQGWHHKTGLHQGGSGLVSTAADYSAFLQMLLDQGRYSGGRILSRPAVRLMTTNQLTDAQRGPHCFLPASEGWGFGMQITLGRADVWQNPGRFGWDGGTGTSGYADPAENLVGVLMTQRFMDSPVMPASFRDFWAMAYAAIDD